MDSRGKLKRVSHTEDMDSRETEDIDSGETEDMECRETQESPLCPV